MSEAFRRSVVGFGAGALLFVGLGVYLNARIGAGAFAHPGPMAVLAVIGGTVGGLVAPLFRRPGRGGRPGGGGRASARRNPEAAGGRGETA